MADESDFLAAIRANPADDTVRLVYADFLDERGEGERAEFIRAGCRLARATVCPTRCGSCDHCTARKECERLAGGIVWQPAWLGEGMDCNYMVGSSLFFRVNPLSPGPDAPKPLLTLARGFVARVEASADLWHAHADAVLARHPVERVALTGVEPYQYPGPPGEWNFSWSRSSRISSVVGPAASMIPPDWFTALSVEVYGFGGDSRWYATREEAVADLTGMLARRYPGVTFELPAAAGQVEYQAGPPPAACDCGRPGCECGYELPETLSATIHVRGRWFPPPR